MHVTLKDPETGEYVELCIPTYSALAIVIRCSSYVSDATWDRAKDFAKAAGCTQMLDATNTAPEDATIPWRLT
jgi:hypothetical protein